MRKKIWINKDDVVLIGLWDFQDDKCSIIHKYADDEVSKLVNKKEIPPNFKVSSGFFLDNFSGVISLIPPG